MRHAGVSRCNMQGLVCNMTICPVSSEAGFFIPAIIKLGGVGGGAVCGNHTVCRLCRTSFYSVPIFSFLLFSALFF